jgi:RNA polymerase sigma factor (TIGR02999 family)
VKPENHRVRQQHTDGELESVDLLFPPLYDELRRIAHRQLRHQAGHTLNTTALVHEAYVKLGGGEHIGFSSRDHFLSTAARVMRQVLVDYARRYSTAKRGGAWQRVAVRDVASSVDAQSETLIALDAALTRMAGVGERMSRVVECRFFGGMTEEETAAALQVTTRTVRRDWAKARLWLYDDLYGDGGRDLLAELDPRLGLGPR